MKMKINGEKGQALPLAMIAVILGALVIPPFVGYAGSSIIGSHAYGDAIRSQYAADSGAEHAIWRLTDDGLMDILTSAGSMVSYTLDETLNGLTTNVTVCNAWQTIADDDFNSGGWSGGTGWLDDWTHSGDSAVTSSGSPYEGPYHLRLRGGSAIAQRPVDLSHQIDIHLRFWAKVNSFETWDTATCQVSSDGINWNTVYTFTDVLSDDIYRYYDFELSSYKMTGQFWISFNSNMSSTGDYFYVDKLDIVWLVANPVTFATEDFESGGWSGGTGWLEDWTHTGASSVTTWSSPYEGYYHLLLQGSNGDVQRPVDLSAAGIVYLRFWAKVSGFESRDNVVCQVSPDGSTWSTIYTWTTAHDDNDYHYYAISLAPYEMTSEFWIRFSSNCNNQNDYFFVDLISLVNLDAYGVTAKAGDSIIKAKVFVDSGVVTIIYWYYV
ncbi:MAG: hypothetical protein JXA17_02395 [Dehalococcoidales bacterium]|nr:hypothetical protein [Dehalococcoidales bacterium]